MKRTNSQIRPVLPLRDIVMFPGMVAPLFVGREKSVRTLTQVVGGNNKILLVTQKDATIDDPTEKDIYKIGVIGNILQLLKLPDGTVKVLIEAQSRVRISNFSNKGELFSAEAETIQEIIGDELETEILMRSVIAQFSHYIKAAKKINPEVISAFAEIKDPGQLADIISSHLFIKIKDKQEILEILDITSRLEKIYSAIEIEIGLLNTKKKIDNRVKKQVEKTHKDYFLNEQLKAIQKELGDGEESKSEIAEIEAQIKKVKLTKEAREKALSELKRLKTMNVMSAEATIIRNYLDWILTLPWGKKNKLNHDIKHAEEVLERDHYGLEQVKERILEYLAVQERTNQLKGPIICLVGPPGVGKTSLAKSIAESVGREFVRFALGGMRDEAEVRGHRRTYIGAMPGKIIQLLKKAKTSNPVFLLDEIDKLGVDFRGDPSSALLEVLDPAQNSKFVDHYLEVEYDLSDVMFIATANSLNIPRPLLDRMEVIRISGYTEQEKIEIAKRYLVPNLIKEHGLDQKEWSINDSALLDLIRYYTREAGVRNLGRELANLTRKAVKEILFKTTTKVAVNSKNLEKYAKVRRYSYGEAEKVDLVGVTTGLAYTEFGGDLLAIEAVVLPGKGLIKATGKLGEVMQESAQAAYSYFKSKSLEFGITPAEYQKKDIHLHVPEGGTPKDGPSAGIAICISIISAMTGIPVKSSVAMTGEITLTGRALAIGGLKEKMLAAMRGGVKTVLIPQENMKDLVEIPDEIKKALKIIPVTTADQAIAYALSSKLKPVKWSNIEINQSEDLEESDVIKH